MIHGRRALECAIAETFASPAGAEKQAATLVDRASPSYSKKVTVKGLVEMPEWRGVYTESAIRGLIDKARVRRSSRGPIRGNGLIEAGALIKVGRRILIDTSKFRTWVESHRVSQEGE